MPSPIDICNMALAHLGDREITRLDDEAQQVDPIVRYCAVYYEQAKMEALSAHRWTFAKKTQHLSREANPVTLGYQYSHVMPTDLLRLMSLHVASDDGEGGFTYSMSEVDKFKMVGNKIWSDNLELAVFYVGDMDDPDEWTPHFRGCVARLMAHYLAGPVADSAAEGQKHLDIYERVALPNAQFYDSIQDQSGENYGRLAIKANSPLVQSHRENLAPGGASYGDY